MPAILGFCGKQSGSSTHVLGLEGLGDGGDGEVVGGAGGGGVGPAGEMERGIAWGLFNARVCAIVTFSW